MPTPSMDDFFNAPDAELVLRSSDGVDFAVHKLILQLSSPVFKTMIGLPQPAVPEAQLSQRPIIEMSEDALTLRLLLQFCYPRAVCAAPDLKRIQAVERAAHVARKFDIGFIREATGQAILRLVSNNANGAYGVAYRFEYPEAIIREVARRSLGPVSEFFFPDYEAPTRDRADPDSLLYSIMGGSTGASRKSLENYKKAVPVALGKISRLGANKKHPIRFLVYADVKDCAGNGDIWTNIEPSRCTCDKLDMWIEGFTFGGGDYPEGPPTYLKPLRRWWWSYVQNVIALMKPDSSGRMSIDKAFLDAMAGAIEGARNCAQCRGQERAVRRLLQGTQEALAKEIEERLKQIPLDAPFLSRNSH